MATDITVMLKDEPGALAKAAAAIAEAGVNIEAVSGDTVGGEGRVHLLFNDPAPARQALNAIGATIASEREVMVLDVVDQPGELARVAKALASAGVNVELAYLATDTRLVLGVDDHAKATAALA